MKNTKKIILMAALVSAGNVYSTETENTNTTATDVENQANVQNGGFFARGCKSVASGLESATASAKFAYAATTWDNVKALPSLAGTLAKEKVTALGSGVMNNKGKVAAGVTGLSGLGYAGYRYGVAGFKAGATSVLQAGQAGYAACAPMVMAGIVSAVAKAKANPLTTTGLAAGLVGLSYVVKTRLVTPFMAERAKAAEAKTTTSKDKSVGKEVTQVVNRQGRTNSVYDVCQAAKAAKAAADAKAKAVQTIKP